MGHLSKRDREELRATALYYEQRMDGSTHMQIVDDVLYAHAERIVARHRAEAKAEALREGATDVELECTSQRGACYCQSADWLRGRADRIEKERYQ